jgi:P27 family predicted phage terminase small subunit
MSRRPKPTALKILEGNRGHRKLDPSTEFTLAPGLPEKPKYMGRAASREWDWISASLVALGVLTPLDGKALSEYCKAFSLAEVYYREAIKRPMVEEFVRDKDGNIIETRMKPNSAIAAWKVASSLCKSFLIEFGLTPASRTRLKIEMPKAKTPEEGFLAQTFEGKSDAPAVDDFALDDDDLKVQ